MMVMVIIRKEMPEGDIQVLTREFGTFRKDWELMCQFLQQHRVDLVVMESTRVCWKGHSRNGGHPPPPAVESAEGTAPSAAHRTVLEPLSSYGSSYPTADTQPNRQCAINNGALLATLPKQREARHFLPLNFLYLPIAQRTSVAST